MKKSPILSTAFIFPREENIFIKYSDFSSLPANSYAFHEPNFILLLMKYKINPFKLTGSTKIAHVLATMIIH